MIDIHTHLWDPERIPESIRRYFVETGKAGFESVFYTAKGLLERMDRAGISKAVVLALAYSAELPEHVIRSINDYVLQESLQSDRLAAFCTVDPLTGERAVPLLEEYLIGKQCKGLKLHGSMQEFYADDKRIYPIYRWMEEHRMPILFHTGGIGLKAYKDKYCSLSAFDEIACDFPELPIILGHAGRYDYTSLAILLRKHKNCYADISTNFSKKDSLANVPLGELIEKVENWTGNTEQLLFGSDFPFYSQEQTVKYVRQTGEDFYSGLERNTEVFCTKYNIF